MASLILPQGSKSQGMIRTMKKQAVCALLVLILAGCANDDEAALPSASTSPSAPAPTTGSIPTTSVASMTASGDLLTIEEACRAWFREPTVDESPAMRSAAIAAPLGQDPSGAGIDPAEVQMLADTLLELGQRVPPSLTADLAQIRQPIADIADIFQTGTNRTVRIGDVKIGSIAILETCATEAPGAAAP